nr:HAMP domain-containing sensor histidine kinase [uncultured Peptostreptococcus sp.]
MKNLKIFPKMFIQIFSVLGIIILLIHLLVFYIFPKTYLENRKEEICTEANKISRNLAGKDINYVNQALDFYSKNSEIKAFVKGQNKKNEVQIKDNVDINMDSNSNSLIIEERTISLNSGKKAYLQFVSTADMQEDAKNLSFKFLPYSLLISLLFSIVVSLIYAKSIKNNIEEIKTVTDRMMTLDKDARLMVDSSDEIGHLKDQINDLYFTLLKSIDDLEFKNREIIKLERLKYDFLKGASHELKTPLASLKIILENMKYNIGKYKNRDLYISDCIDIVDGLTHNISQILSVSSLDNLKDDEEVLCIGDILVPVLDKYEVLANQKNIRIENLLGDETIYIGKRALRIILSNLVSNAVKYTEEGGLIKIGVEDGWFYIENSCPSNKSLDMDKVFDVKFDLNKENSNGLGLYIVSNLLNNYKIGHRVLQGQSTFAFKIDLANRQNME